MTPQLVYMQIHARPVVALTSMLDLGITAVPILDNDGRPVAIVSLRDIVDPRVMSPHATHPVASIGQDEPVEAGARKLVDAGVHHLVVLDGDGRAIGMLSVMDVIRGLLGLEPRHPPTLAEPTVPTAT
jgi:CBS domain-containing protein